MIKAREYYSDVFIEEDDKQLIRCNWCEKEFKIGDLLLKINSDDNDYNEEDITEHCPYCETSGCLMDIEKN